MGEVWFKMDRSLFREKELFSQNRIAILSVVVSFFAAFLAIVPFVWERLAQYDVRIYASSYPNDDKYVFARSFISNNSNRAYLLRRIKYFSPVSGDTQCEGNHLNDVDVMHQGTDGRWTNEPILFEKESIKEILFRSEKDKLQEISEITIDYLDDKKLEGTIEARMCLLIESGTVNGSATSIHDAGSLWRRDGKVGYSARIGLFGEIVLDL
ncbi:hypothetical protein [Jiella mangrovi]|uniref:LPS export ABC transporter periplasmic protein LptC n=1 Tax=Jiella mangrovi TaxID=2821407 RepID=A0ABS4BNF8_9HYPH|nr:hypothetical protein [Jiella mangrovi]MBP0618264.1 hypothetical protein [Jiella mangrovi]